MFTYDTIKSQFESSRREQRRTLTIEGYAHAGVLVPLIVSNDGIELLFTKRTETVETHKGQISFPGGMVDGTDNDIIHTALREAEEEIGLHHSHVEVIGLLDDMATPTGFVITPVVGIISTLPTLNVNEEEVAEVFHVQLDFFADDNNGRSEQREFRGKKYEIWFYNFGEHLIWGATAMMVRSLLKQISHTAIA